MKHFLRTHRVTILFAGIYLFTFAVAVYGVSAARHINTALGGVYDRGLVPMDALQRARQEALYFSRSQVDLLVEPTESGKRRFESAGRVHSQAVSDAIASVEAENLSPAARDELRLFQAQWDEYLFYAAKVRRLSYEGDDQAALRTMRTESRPRVEAASATLGRIVSAQAVLGKEARMSSADVARESFLLAALLIGVLSSAVVAVVALGVYQIGRSVSVLREMLRESN